MTHQCTPPPLQHLTHFLLFFLFQSCLTSWVVHFLTSLTSHSILEQAQSVTERRGDTAQQLLVKYAHFKLACYEIDVSHLFVLWVQHDDAATVARDVTRTCQVCMHDRTTRCDASFTTVITTPCMRTAIMLDLENMNTLVSLVSLHSIPTVVVRISFPRKLSN